LFAGLEHGSNLRPRTELLMREKASLSNSLAAADDLIEQAAHARDRLARSRQTVFQGLQTRLGQLGTRFPVLNSLIAKVQAHKYRDVLVLGLVIGLCLIFTFYFW